MNVTVAPTWRRALAGLIDLVVVLGLWALVTWAIVGSDPEPPIIPPWNPLDRIVDYIQARPGRTALSFAALALLHVAWTFVWTRASSRGASLGQRALGLVTIDRQGRRPSSGRLLGWLAARLPSTFLAGVGLWWALVDRERRTLHDRVARVWVIRRA